MELVQEGPAAIWITESNFEIDRGAKRKGDRDLFLNCPHPYFRTALQHLAEFRKLALR